MVWKYVPHTLHTSGYTHTARPQLRIELPCTSAEATLCVGIGGGGWGAWVSVRVGVEKKGSSEEQRGGWKKQKIVMGGGGEGRKLPDQLPAGEQPWGLGWWRRSTRGWIWCGEQKKGIASGGGTRRHMGQIWPTSLVLQIKFYWNTTIFICLQIVSGCFHASTAELNSCSRDHRTRTAYDIYYPALFRKHLPNVCLDHRVHTALSHSNATDLILSMAKPDSTPHGINLFSFCTYLKLCQIRLGKVRVCDISFKKN